MMPLPMAGKNADKNTDALLLSRTRVATPCRAEWAQMIGDDKSRYCGSCKKNVYNLSAMTGKEATALIREKEGNLCIRYYQRVDGTVMTQDCPVGIAAVKRKITRAFATSIVVSVAMLSAFAQWWHGNNIFADRLSVWAERLHPTPPVEFNPHSPPSHTRLQPPPPPQTPEAIMGAPAVMGEMAPEPEAMLGRMRIEPSTQDR